jgi:hypothetical protein
MKSKNRHTLVLLAWVTTLIIFFSGWGIVSYSIINEDKLASELRHYQRLADDVHGLKNPDFQTANAIENPLAPKVKVGIYVERIIKLESTDTEWISEFYIWFITEDLSLRPGDTFQILNGDILEIDKIKSMEQSGQRYTLFKVIASITKFFNIVRYPLDNHLLTIQIEDKKLRLHQLEYTVDAKNSNLSSRLQAPGYGIDLAKITSRVHAYQSNRGELGVTAQESLFSQFSVGLQIYRPDLGLYFKMFQGLFAAVMVAFIAFFLGYQGGDRIGIGIGAFFAAVANGYISMNELPHGGLLTLTDIVNGFGLFTIFMTIISSQIASWLSDQQDARHSARSLDNISFTVCLVGYVAVNVLVVKVA